MEKFKILIKNEKEFLVGNKGTIKFLGTTKEKLFDIKSDISDFSLSGGHKDNHYLSTHGQSVHRLVAEAWIGPIPDGMTVNHKDLDKFNNDVDNLEIITLADNLKHAWENGVYDHLRISEFERHRREIFHDFKEWNNKWIVYDLNFKMISRHSSQEEAANSINVTRQTANQSFRRGTPILKQYFICKPKQVKELKEQILKIMEEN